MGAIPVDRSKKTSVTDQVVEMFRANKTFQVAVTPEGTRKANPNWKKGFYYIAKDAKVPIVLAGMDYGKKLMVFGKIIIPSDNLQQDMLEIKRFYEGFQAKNPEGFNLGL
jgi:1-acyl-sn-glycerol-3-phosphate acyltransferase